jgi:NitT/TauT family transport system substrate-binding protein
MPPMLNHRRAHLKRVPAKIVVSEPFLVEYRVATLSVTGSAKDRSMRRIIVASLLALLPMFCARVDAQQAAPQKINVAYAFVASSTLPLWVAEEEGLFKKYGLDAKLISFPGSAAATQALLGGSVDIVFGSASAAITVVGRGIPVVVLATTHLLDYQLVARPNVTNPAQLRGGTLGISAFSGGDDFAARRLLPLIGLTYDKDVKFVVLGTPNPYQKAEAVLAGTTDATLANFEVTDTLKLQGKPMSVLASILDKGIKLSIGDIYVTRSYLAKSPETVKNFLRAFSEAIRLAKNDKQLTFDLLKKYTRTDNPAIQQEVYKRIVVDQFEAVPYTPIETIVVQRDDMSLTSPDLAKLKDMKPESFVDNGPLKALEQEGFFKNLPPVKPQ